MKKGEPAGSAEGVAIFRAIESARPAGDRLFCDPYARGLLPAGARAAVALTSVPLLGPTLLAVADQLTYGQREPFTFTFGIDPGTLGTYLAERGFERLDDAAGEELTRRYFRPRGRRDRPNEYQRIARARVPGASARDQRDE